MSQHREHLQLFLRVGRGAVGDGAEEGKLARVEGLRGVVAVSLAEKDCLGHAEGDGECANRVRPGKMIALLDGGEMALIDVRFFGELDLREALQAAQATKSLTERLLFNESGTL